MANRGLGHISSAGEPRQPLRAALRPPLKRALDFVLAAFILVFLAPLMCLVALAVRIASGRPALVARVRIGRAGAEFGLLGYRIVDVYGVPSRLGEVLYATRIDGLPRLLNVLRGEMSLVGPRPATRAELLMLGTEAGMCYVALRPGLTGPWRLVGLGSDAEDADGGMMRVALDVPYALTPSLRADLRILLHTLGVVLGLRGL